MTAQPIAAELRSILENMVGLLENCSVSTGACCCGDDMAGHASPMTCGHSPVDQGQYYADQLLQDVVTALARCDTQQTDVSVDQPTESHP